ncbi:MAG: thiolase family protein [Promethearchaeota archaeon]
MRRVCIIGVGMTEFRHRPESIQDIGAQAIKLAFDEVKNLELKDIQAVYCGTMGGGPSLASRIMARCKDVMGQEGLTGVPMSNWENMCVSGTNAIMAAYLDIASGLHDIVLQVGVEKLGRGSLAQGKDGRLTTAKFKGPPPAPAMFAGQAKRHMKRFGTTREHLAMVAVKSKEYASRNPNAQYRKKVTIDEVLNSKMIAEPLTMLMCCPTSTGGSSVIFCAEDIARKYQDTLVEFVASSMKTCRAKVPTLESGWDPNIRAGRESYKRAGIGPTDIGVAQVHDCFAIAELMHYESFGFCDMGKSGEWIEDGGPTKDGEVPVNTDGGLISKGHPLGATGGAQFYELTNQLRGTAHTQIKPIPEYALQHNMGGGVGVGMAYVCNILKRLR